MKKSTKKKILTLALVIALLAIAVVGGSLAWFTAEDEVKNEFTVGSIDIELVENFEEPDKMLPIVNIQNPEADANFINKDVYVKNTGKNDAYVQVLIAVPQELNRAGAFHYKEVNKDKWSGGVLIGSQKIGNYEYDVYRYRYNDKVGAGTETEYVITGAYLDAKLDYDNDRNRFVMDGVEISNYVPGETIDIYVIAQAVQAEGFANATDALDGAFGNTIPTFNP